MNESLVNITINDSCDIFIYELVSFLNENKDIIYLNKIEFYKDKSLFISKCVFKKNSKLEKLCKTKNLMLWKKIIIIGVQLRKLKINLFDHYHYVRRNYSDLIRCEEKHINDYKLKNKKIYKVCEYFYTDLLKTKGFEREYCNNKNIKEQFIKKSKLNTICPYCGITLLKKDQIDIDHFLPQNNFPYLSIFSKNLVVCCSGCNQRAKNKNIIFPILHPVFDVISDNIDILYHPTKKEKFVLTCKKDAAKNFAIVFNLKEKYNQLENHKEANSFIRERFAFQKFEREDDLRQIEEFILQKSKDSLLRLEMKENEKIVFIKIYKNFFKILIDDIEKKTYNSDEYKFIKQYIENNKKRN